MSDTVDRFLPHPTGALVCTDREDAPIDLNADLKPWLTAAGPARGAFHWRDGRSAKEVARLWCGNPGVVPADLMALLSTHPSTIGFSATRAVPERKTTLWDTSSGPRNHDVALWGVSDGRRVLVGVEAKADEPFDQVIAKKRAGATPPSRIPARIDTMLAAVFETGDQILAAQTLHYQLLTGLVGTLVEAHASAADQAVFVVHVFAPSTGSPTRQSVANDAAWRAFVDLLDTRGFAAGQPNAAYSGRLIQVVVPGSAEIASMPLLVGKTTTYLA